MFRVRFPCAHREGTQECVYVFRVFPNLGTKRSRVLSSKPCILSPVLMEQWSPDTIRTIWSTGESLSACENRRTIHLLASPYPRQCIGYVILLHMMMNGSYIYFSN